MLSRQYLTSTTIFIVTILCCYSGDGAYSNGASHTKYDLSEQYLEEQFENLTDPGLYNRHVRPPSKGPTKVFTSLNIVSINAISSQYLQLNVILLISHAWLDLRLNYHNQTKYFDDDSLCLEGTKWHLDRVWWPSLFLLNEQQGRLMNIIDDNLYISVCPHGNIYYQYRIQETLHCSMDLSRFPFDTQMCKIELGSWRYSNSSVVLDWDSDYIPVTGDVIVVNEFKLNRFKFRKELRQDLGRGSRSYSVLVVELYLDRQWGYYFIQYYVTSFILVFISWISLWLDQAAAPARVTLGTSTLLTFVTLSSNSKAVLPKVSVITVIDSWYFICMLFIVATLLEYALVNITYRRQSVVHMKKPVAKYIMKSALSSEAPTPRRLSVASFSQAYFTNPNYDYNEMNQRSVMSLPDLEKYQSNNLTVAMGSRDITNLKDMKNEQFLQANKLPKDKIEVAQNNSQMEVKLDALKDDTSDNNSFNYDPDDEQDANNKEKDTISDSIPEVKVTVPTLGRFEKPFYEMTYPEIAQWIDTRSRILFPLLFLLINTIYWIAIVIPTPI